MIASIKTTSLDCRLVKGRRFLRRLATAVVYSLLLCTQTVSSSAALLDSVLASKEVELLEDFDCDEALLSQSFTAESARRRSPTTMWAGYQSSPRESASSAAPPISRFGRAAEHNGAGVYLRC